MCSQYPWFTSGSFLACDSSSFPMLPVCPFKMKNVTLLIHVGLFIVDGISVYKSSLQYYCKCVLTTFLSREEISVLNLRLNNENHSSFCMTTKPVKFVGRPHQVWLVQCGLVQELDVIIGSELRELEGAVLCCISGDDIRAIYRAFTEGQTKDRSVFHNRLTSIQTVRDGEIEERRGGETSEEGRNVCKSSSCYRQD